MELRFGWCSLVLAICYSCFCVGFSATATDYEIKNCLPPSIKKPGPSRMYFIVKELVQIPCIAAGNKTLVYAWRKDGQLVDLNSPENKGRLTMEPGVGTLVFTQALDKDSGSYQCQVTNNCGTALSRTTKLYHAMIDLFTPLDKPELVKAMLGARAKLTCHPPASVPNAVIAWILMDSQDSMKDTDDMDYDDVGFNTVAMDRRVTMDYNGNLYITNVRKEDEQGGKTYVCMAQNMITRSSNKGEDKVVQVQGVTPTSFGVDLMWHSETSIMVLQGRRAKFKCIFSGNPEPEVTWSRVTGDMDKTRMLYDHHELIIKDVQYEDAGEYTCMGRNTLKKEPMTHTFTLSVEAAPQWRSTPRDVSVGVEESASFECDAVGNPDPTIEWFINGKSVDDLPSNPRQTIKGNSLLFTDLEKGDSKVIQCNASNIHGSVWSDVYLYVQALPPTMEKEPKEEVIVAEDQELKVTCQVTGKPKPKVIWYKGAQALVHKRFQILENGDLLIKKTTKKDTGTYKCQASNKFGTIEAEGKVVVRQKTRITSGPMGEQVDYTNPVYFTCYATTDELETENLRYRWLKDGAELKSSDRIMIEGRKLTITDTSSKDTGVYTCVAENGLDNDTATAKLQVKAVPDPPYDITIADCLAKKAVITWQFEEEMRNFDTMTKFIVEMTTQYKPDIWTKEATAPYPTKKVEIALSPYAHYKFRVKAVNLMGISEPSNTTYSGCETPMSVPDKNPDGVRTDEKTTNYLVVQWDPMEKIDLNGPEFRYIVEVQEIGTEEIQTFEVDDYKIGEKRIKVDNIYRPYFVKVRAVNQVGKAMANPLTITGYSGEAEPKVVPENFELDPDVNVTATSAGFRWDPVDTSPEVIQGEFSGYKIRFWKKGQQETSFHEHIVQDNSNGRQRRQAGSDGKMRGMVANLPSYADIEADVVVINKNFQSNSSNVVNFSTPEGVPGRVSYLQALYRGSHHFLLQWGKPVEQNGIIQGYRISYRKIRRLDFDKEVVAYDNIDADEDRITLKGLEPDSQYRIYIQAHTSKGLGKQYFIDVRTNNIVLSMALPVVKDVIALENEANITWEILSPSRGSRHGQMYYIEYKKKGHKNWERSPDPVEGQFWAELKHLDPGTHYEVRVLAVAHEKGPSRPSNFYPFVTAGTGFWAMALTRGLGNATEAHNGTQGQEPTLAGAARASFLTAAWFIGMMVAIAVLILILIIVCIIKRNRGDNYPVQEKERLRGNYNEDNPDHFNGFGKGDENGVGGSSSFDRDAEKVPLDEDTDSLDYGDDDASKFNEDGSFIGQYGPGEKGNETTNASSIV